MSNGNKKFRSDFGWDNVNSPGNSSPGNQKLWQATGTRHKDDIRQKPIEQGGGTLVQFPPHLFPPAGAQSLDERVAADIAAGSVLTELFSFTAPKGAVVHFLGYSIFSDGALAANQLFVPKVNGRRVFPYHGDPADGLINLGLSPDLSVLIPCQLTLNPGDKMQWFVTNLNAVDIAMGVRMNGYVDTDMRRVNARSGG